MTPTTYRLRKELLAFAPLLMATQLLAQKPNAAPADSETIELTPFEVRSESVKGYAASETMTGSRVAVQIVDLPYTVNVVTNEFITDFGMFEISDNLT